MKAIQKIFLTMLLFSGITVAAGAATVVKIEKSGYEKKISVIIEELKSSATVQIVTATGTILAEEKVTKGAFAKIFNLQNLPNGKYRLLVQMEYCEVVQPFQLTRDDLLLNAAHREEYFPPVLNLQSNALDLTLLNTRLVNVTVSILDEAGNQVFEDNLRNVFKVERRYNLADLGKGRYTVQVTTPYRSYYRNIEVK